LGFDYFDNADSPEVLKHAFLVSLHGSTDKRIGHGYKIVIMRKGEKPRDFVSGFLQGRTVVGRPCDIMKLDANSFLFTDDHSGIIYYVRKKGWRSSAAVLPQEQPETAVALGTSEPPPASSGTRSCMPAALFALAAILRQLV